MSVRASFALRGRNPDVLTCIANLSNDEVFTPPEFANRMLDTLADAWAEGNGGADIWADQRVRFLDPCTKSGVFLREITSRLTKGLAAEIPNLQERVNHILTRQVFGIGMYSEILWAVGIVAIVWLMLKKTRFGTHVTATGGNFLGAAEAGIPVRRVKVWSFMILSLGAGFIGILDAIRIGSLDPAASGLDVVLPGIVAAVIGGTALTGGRGTVLGTFIGAVFLGVLAAGVNIIGGNANWFMLAAGSVNRGAMAGNIQLGNLAERTKR
jgi:ribose/xylose/arabinose/galactoside ABC-type transport system permease subunit